MAKIKSRQLELILYLLKNKKTTYGQLARQFEVSTKTIERDIDALSAMGIPVHCVQGVGGGVLIEENYKLSKSFFSQEDIHGIILALTMFDSVVVQPRKKDILNKLCMIAPELVDILEYETDNYVVFDLVADKLDMESCNMQHINQCLNDEVLLDLTINGKAYTVAPISYILKPDGFYLYCYDTEYRLFRVHDISNTSVTQVEFERDFIPYTENDAVATVTG